MYPQIHIRNCFPGALLPGKEHVMGAEGPAPAPGASSLFRGIPEAHLLPSGS